MATVSVGVREFQEHLSEYIQSDAPVAITQDGRKVGTFIPAHRVWTEEDRRAFKEASHAVQSMMDAAGITEEQIIEDIDRVIREDKQQRNSHG